jgi:cell division protein FtsX
VYALKLALRPWRLQPLSQLLTLFTIGIMLLLAGFFGSLARGLPDLRSKLDGDHVASVFIDPAVESTGVESIRDRIRVSLGSSSVAVNYVDSEAFLSSLRANQPELAREIEAMGGEKDWIVPKHFSLRGTIRDKEVELLKSIPGVEAVAFSEKRFKPIVDNLAAIEWMSRVLFAAIVFAMIAVLALLGRLNASIFKETEAMIAQMGGSAWESRFPSRLNPFLLAGSAGTVAALCYLKFSPWFATKLSSLSPFLAGIETNATQSFGWVIGLGFATAFLTVLISPSSGKVVR